MLEPKNNAQLPAIPGKRYFTIGEVSELCGVKPHVLRYWEQEFPQLKPVKRRGNRRYYQRQDVIVIRQIRSLLYDQGFTIGGARNKLTGEEARTDVSQSQQIVKQVRVELEDLMKVLRRSPRNSVSSTPRALSPPRVLSFNKNNRFGAWRSLVAHLHGVQGVPSSNLGAPTIKNKLSRMVVTS
jgi:DNA-binding transcriptional MerR regulator